jgi:membrane fusion protein (multidrug efflux system)
MELPQKREDQRPKQDEHGNGPRRGLLRRHPFAFLAGLLLLLAGAAGGYLY